MKKPLVILLILGLGDLALTLLPAWRVLADGDWMAAVNVSSTSGDSYSPDIVVDDVGTAHVVWTDYDPGNPDIFYASKTAGGNWSSPTNVSNNANFSEAPRLAVDSARSLHMVWSDYTPGNADIFYASKALGGDWSLPANVSSNSGSSYNPVLAIDADKAVHLVWVDFTPGNADTFYATKGSGRGWSLPLNVSNNAGGSGGSLRLTIDAEGQVHVVWQDDTDSAGKEDIFYAVRNRYGEWSSPCNVSNSPFHHSYSPNVAVDGVGAVYAVWADQIPITSVVFFAEKPLTGSWSTPVTVSDWTRDSVAPQLAVEGNGTVHIVWKDYAPGMGDIFYAFRDPVGTWSIPQSISPLSGSGSWPPDISVHNAAVHLVWDNGSYGNGDIFYAGKPPIGDWSMPINLSDSPGRSGEPSLALGPEGVPHIIWLDRTPGNLDVFYSTPLQSRSVIRGLVDLQGRSDEGGALIALGGGSGSYTTTTAADGTFTVTAVAAGTYTATASMPGYLYAQRTSVLVSEGITTTLPLVKLMGGDADNDSGIGIYDLTLLGANFGLRVPPGDTRADINGDGAVNIFDIVLVGTNYGLAAPRPWP